MESASGPLCTRPFLELAAAAGWHREIVALLWSDLHDGRAHISRSLTRTRAGLEFPCTKTGKPLKIKIPTSAQAALEEHRKR